MRTALILSLAIAIGVVLALPVGLTAANASGPRDDIMPLSEVKVGMKGHGLTVFSGTKPARFGVEVLGIIENFRPEQPLILIRTHHPRLKAAKIVAGMSGSPIYINGKMIGAYAYGWTFPVEQVAGVTPIENMLRDLDRPLLDELEGWPMRALPRAKNRKLPARDPRAYAGSPAQYDALAHAKQVSLRRQTSLALGADGIQPLATPLLMGGWPPGAMEAAKELLEPLGLVPTRSGGGGRKSGPVDTSHAYVAGGAVGIPLISGDMSASGLGTVTRVEGQRLIAFGHPMMSVGMTALPAAVAKVVWILASEARSFKLGYDVRPLGAMVNDRPASIVIDERVKAPVIPVTVKLRGVLGAAKTTWNFDIAQDKVLTPQLFAMAVGSALEMAASEQRQSVTWAMTSRLKVQGQREIVLDDFGVSDSGLTPRLLFRTALVAAAGSIINNPWEPAFIERLDVVFDVKYARDVDRLRGVELLTPTVRAGEPARLRITVEPFRGAPKIHNVTVPIAASYAGSKVKLRIRPGYADHPIQAPPQSLAELLNNLGEPSFPARSLIVAYDTHGEGVAFDGRVATDLPVSALDMLRPRYSSISPQPFSSEARQIIPLDDFLTGTDSVTVVVKPNLR